MQNGMESDGCVLHFIIAVTDSGGTRCPFRAAAARGSWWDSPARSPKPLTELAKRIARSQQIRGPSGIPVGMC
jgi:hypothetical protein